MSKIVDRNGTVIEKGCEFKTTLHPDVNPLRCIGVLESWIFVIQDAKDSIPWSIPIAELTRSQYYVSKKADNDAQQKEDKND